MTTRRIDPLLIDTDATLRAWAPFAGHFYASKGLPIQLRPCCVHAARPTWPSAVIATDEIVQVLHWQLCSAILAHYLHPEELLGGKADIYRQLVGFFLARLPSNGRRRRAAGYDRDLMVGRWVMRALLRRDLAQPMAFAHAAATGAEPARALC